MTDTTCMPRKPLRCWQYRENSDDPIPRWVVSCISLDRGEKPKFVGEDGSRNTVIDDGDWILEAGEISIYSQKGFEKDFEVLKDG